MHHRTTNLVCCPSSLLLFLSLLSPHCFPYYSPIYFIQCHHNLVMIVIATSTTALLPFPTSLLTNKSCNNSTFLIDILICYTAIALSIFLPSFYPRSISFAYPAATHCSLACCDYVLFATSLAVLANWLNQQLLLWASTDLVDIQRFSNWCSYNQW